MAASRLKDPTRKAGARNKTIAGQLPEHYQMCLAYISAGLTIEQATVKAGTTATNFTRYRERHPIFHTQCSQAIREVKESKRIQRKSAIIADFIGFRMRWFGHTTPRHHMKMIHAFFTAGPDSITLISSFPESAKTSVVEDLITYLIVCDPNIRICVVSEATDLAQKIIGVVSRRLTDENLIPGFVEEFGPFKSADKTTTWTQDYFRVIGATVDQKDYTLECRGWKSALYGGRFDIIFMDDLQSDKSLNATEDMLRYIRQTVITRLSTETGGHCVITGSRVGDNDIYDRLVEEDIVDDFIIIPALTAPVEREQHYGRVKKDGRWEVVALADCPAMPTWPEWWTPDRLAKRRKKVGEDVWARTYMQTPKTSGLATFTADQIEPAKNLTRSFGPIKGFPGDSVLTVDPALSSGVCVFMAMMCDGQRRHKSRKGIVITDIVTRHDITGYDLIVDEIGRLDIIHDFDIVIIEQNNFQKGLLVDDRLLKLAKAKGFRVYGHQTSSNKNDSEFGIPAMPADFIDHNIDIPYSEECRSQVQPLINELYAWRPKVKGALLPQDHLMTLWFGWLHYVKNKKTRALNIVRERPTWAA